MHVLVTGGCGFIGSAFVRWVLTEHDEVRVTNIDALTYAGNPANVAPVADLDRYTFVHADIRDAELLDQVMAGADAVVNFAAETHVDRSIDGPAPFLTTNVAGAGVVFDAARRRGIERILHISTDEVYGSIDVGSFREDDPLRPNSPYAASKAGADLLARSYGETYDHPISVTRTTNNYGPYHYPEKVIPLFITNLLEDGKMPLYGDGGNVRDWIHVEDNARAQWLVLTEADPGSVVNIGGGNELSNRALAGTLADAFGRGEDAIEFVADRPGHDRRYSVDTTRIRNLGWEPAISFEDGIATVIDWYRENRDWWEPLRAAGAAHRRGTGDSEAPSQAHGDS
jgi:dTDP-glucose 4,6-dehydratase